MREKNTSTSSGGKQKQGCCQEGARWERTTLGVTCARLYTTSQNQIKPIRTWVLGGVPVKTVSNHIPQLAAAIICATYVSFQKKALSPPRRMFWDLNPGNVFYWKQCSVKLTMLHVQLDCLMVIGISIPLFVSIPFFLTLKNYHSHDRESQKQKGN